MAAGDTIYALDRPDAKTDVNDSTGTTTSTSFTTTLSGAGTPSVVFVAPTSGRVLLLYQAEMVNSDNNRCECAPVVREGSTPGAGDVVLAADEESAIAMTGTGLVRMGTHYMLSGLTAGASYNAQLAFRVNGGTGSFDDKRITVIPLP